MADKDIKQLPQFDWLQNGWLRNMNQFATHFFFRDAHGEKKTEEVDVSRHHRTCALRAGGAECTC